MSTGKSLSESEYIFFIGGSGLPPSAPLGDHKLAYFAAQGYGGNASIHKPLSQIETEWLKGTTGIASDELLTLWAKMCSVAGAPVGKSINECKFNYYSFNIA